MMECVENGLKDKLGFAIKNFAAPVSKDHMVKVNSTHCEKFNRTTYPYSAGKISRRREVRPLRDKKDRVW